MMKNVKRIIKNKNLVSNTADTVNLAGGAAFSKSNTELLDQFAMTGTLGCSFYATAEEVEISPDYDKFKIIGHAVSKIYDVKEKK
jgi:hypothetical protein